MLKRVIVILAFIAIVFHPRIPVEAHPHAWIDLETTALFDESGKFTGLEQTWLFGDFYSGYVLADIGSDDREVIIKGLREVGSSNLRNLREYDYFTRIETAGKAQSISDVDNFETGVINGRVYLKFTTSLREAVDPQKAVVRYATYDPSYYIEILYTEESFPRLQATGAPVCSIDLERPSPTFDQLAYAASLDQTDTASDGLGKLFAEWTTIACD